MLSFQVLTEPSSHTTAVPSWGFPAGIGHKAETPQLQEHEADIWVGNALPAGNVLTLLRAGLGTFSGWNLLQAELFGCC